MFALLVFAVVALAATVLTIVAAVTTLIVALAIAGVVLAARSLLPASWRRHTVPSATPWPEQTIEGTVVNRVGSSDERDLARLDGDKG